jgi:hypothetical protein
MRHCVTLVWTNLVRTKRNTTRFKVERLWRWGYGEGVSSTSGETRDSSQDAAAWWFLCFKHHLDESKVDYIATTLPGLTKVAGWSGLCRRSHCLHCPSEEITVTPKPDCGFVMVASMLRGHGIAYDLFPQKWRPRSRITTLFWRHLTALWFLQGMLWCW